MFTICKTNKNVIQPTNKKCKMSQMASYSHTLYTLHNDAFN